MKATAFRVSLIASILAGVLLGGCAGSRQAIIMAERAELDSLRFVAARLGDQVLALQDSIQFYDDIESGYYYQEQNTLLGRIEKLDYQLTVCGEGGLTVATLLVDDLFEPASATLTGQGAERLAALAGELAASHGGHQIRVEGHTDSVPPGEKMRQQYPTNWELSAARATAVVRHLVEAHALPAALFEAVGLGDSRPAARNDTAEGRRLNRRVRITALEKPGEAGDAQ